MRIFIAALALASVTTTGLAQTKSVTIAAAGLEGGPTGYTVMCHIFNNSGETLNDGQNTLDVSFYGSRGDSFAPCIGPSCDANRFGNTCGGRPYPPGENPKVEPNQTCIVYFSTNVRDKVACRATATGPSSSNLSLRGLLEWRDSANHIISNTPLW
jgi:hypothetical protein